MIGDIFDGLWSAVEAVGNAIADIANFLWTAVKSVGNAIADAVSAPVVAARVAAEAVVDFLGAAETVDWVLLVVAAGLLWYVWRRVRWAGALGPVRISDVEGADDTQKRVLSALLREELTSKGLVPSGTAVPAGSPDASVIAAISTSPIAQAGWIGKILEAAKAFMPRPREYDVTAVLVDRSAVEAREAKQAGKLCGLTYTLAATGRPPVYDVKAVWADSPEHAVSTAAEAIYVRVSQSDGRVFPRWARWSKLDAFESYLEGLKREDRIADAADKDALGLIEAAQEGYARATAQQPANRLPQLRAANMDEARAALKNKDVPARRKFEARALRTYVEIMNDVPTLAEAHYRASVLFSGFDPNKAPYSKATRRVLLRALKLERGVDEPEISDPKIWKGAKSRAEDEAKTTLTLLRWWGILWKSGRLRNRFEPRGRDRRQFLKAAKISRRCTRLQLGCGRGRWDDLWVWGAIAGRSDSVGWQAYYNAGCYYALRPNPDKAIVCLERALADPTNGVTRFWLRHDSDLRNVHGNARWAKLLAWAKTSESG
jgi:hypothetical protein